MRRWTRLLLAVCFVIAGVSGASITRAGGTAASIVDAGTFPARWSAERLANYPFRTRFDMALVGQQCLSLRQDLLHDPLLERASRAPLGEFLAQIQAFTSTNTGPQEKFTIVNFATSRDKAVVRLRDQVRLPPPPGGAIVRIYPSLDAIPLPIRELFGPDTGGVTRECRYVAVWTGQKPPDELRDTISHELVHAYILSSLGINASGLPRWFHEGAAEYLSGGKPQYFSQSDMGGGRVDYSPKDYNDFRLVFRYLEAKTGRSGVDSFIRRVVEQRSVAGPLRAAIGVSSFAALLDQAQGWSMRWQIGYALGIVAGVLVLGLLFRLNSVRQRNRFDRAMWLIGEARALALAGRREAAAAKLDEARRLEPWAADVRLAIQQTRREMGEDATGNSVPGI